MVERMVQAAEVYMLFVNPICGHLKRRMLFAHLVSPMWVQVTYGDVVGKERQFSPGIYREL